MLWQFLVVVVVYGALYVGLPLLGLYVVVRIIRAAWNR
jgi:hypothetical protein